MAKEKSEFRVLILYPNLPLMLVPPISVGLFTRLLKAEGFQVDLFDTTHYLSDEISSPQNRAKFLQVRSFDDKKDRGVEIKDDLIGDFQRKVADYQPDLILVSVTEDVFSQACSLLESVAEMNIPHVVGGVFPTYASEVAIAHPVIQMICRGEGEKVVVDAAEAVRLGASLSTIKGTWFKDSDGHIHKNAPPPLVNISETQPDFSLFEDSRFYRPMGGRILKSVPIETYRGCPYNCSFCNSPSQRRFAQDENLDNFLRRKDLTSLGQEMKELVALHDPDLFYFIDDAFLARPRKENFSFCDMYEDIGIPFWCQSRAENCSADILARLKEVGCYRISFGIECGNEEYRRTVLGRKPSNAEIIDHFQVIAASGLPYSVNLIIGMPGETRDLIMDTIDLVRSIRGYDGLTVSVFVPYHGTVMREVAVQNGWLPDDSLSRHTMKRSQLKMPPPYLNAAEIDGLIRVLPLYCYFPKSEWDDIRRAETDDEEGNRILQQYSDIYRKEFLGETQEQSLSRPLVGAAGCRTNPKDSFRVSPDRLTKDQIKSLTLPGC